MYGESLAELHETYMRRALTLAELGEGFTNPNPLVGAVLVKDDTIISEGYHAAYGGAHAEAAAIAASPVHTENTTLYVNLEPCSHYGKTSPCTEAIIKHGISRVVLSMIDPNPVVAGKGITALRNHGIEVITGVLEQESRKLNEIFIKYITTGLPFCTLKTAMTLDGKIATVNGASKWITNELSRESVHLLRNRTASVMVGVDTVIADDPLLNVRIPDRAVKDPLRIIADSRGRIPLNSRVLKTASHIPTLVAVTPQAREETLQGIRLMGARIMILPEKNGRVDLNCLMTELGKEGIDSVLLEGGSELNYAALEAGIVDKVQAFIAPKIIGGNTAKSPVGGAGIAKMEQALLLHHIEYSQSGEDIVIEGYL